LTSSPRSSRASKRVLVLDPTTRSDGTS
jgi:hypothetical protein